MAFDSKFALIGAASLCLSMGGCTTSDNDGPVQTSASTSQEEFGLVRDLELRGINPWKSMGRNKWEAVDCGVLNSVLGVSFLGPDEGETCSIQSKKDRHAVTSGRREVGNESGFNEIMFQTTQNDYISIDENLMKDLAGFLFGQAPIAYRSKDVKTVSLREESVGIATFSGYLENVKVLDEDGKYNFISGEAHCFAYVENITDELGTKPQHKLSFFGCTKGDEPWIEESVMAFVGANVTVMYPGVSIGTG